MSITTAFDDTGIAPRLPPENDALILFKRHLNVILADSADLLDLAFRLRYQVYCVERGFENAADFSDGRERDRDDVRSLHALLVDRVSEVAIGTVRLILPRRGDELPVFGVVGSGKRRTIGLPFETTAEVSRFAVAKAFRRRFDSTCCLDADRSRGRAPARGVALQLLSFGLIRAVTMMSACAGISHIVGMMEPALLRLLGRLGIVFYPLGAMVEYHGLRQPGWAVMTELIASIKGCNSELGAIIADAEEQEPRTAAYARA
jgi:N-acyl amino acid synthase of PEP-CTERM/exosortase system